MQILRPSQSQPLATQAHGRAGVCRSLSLIPKPTWSSPTPTLNIPEDKAELASLIAAWPTLPEPLKAGILAMIDAARSKGG